VPSAQYNICKYFHGLKPMALQIYCLQQLKLCVYAIHEGIRIRIRSGQVRSGPVRSGQVRSGPVRSGQDRDRDRVRIGSGSGQDRVRIGIGIRSGQVRSGQVRAGQGRAGQGRVFYGPEGTVFAKPRALALGT